MKLSYIFLIDQNYPEENYREIDRLAEKNEVIYVNAFNANFPVDHHPQIKIINCQNSEHIMQKEGAKVASGDYIVFTYPDHQNTLNEIFYLSDRLESSYPNIIMRSYVESDSEPQINLDKEQYVRFYNISNFFTQKILSSSFFYKKEFFQEFEPFLSKDNTRNFFYIANNFHLYEEVFVMGLKTFSFRTLNKIDMDEKILQERVYELYKELYKTFMEYPIIYHKTISLKEESFFYLKKIYFLITSIYSFYIDSHHINLIHMMYHEKNLMSNIAYINSYSKILFPKMRINL